MSVGESWLPAMLEQDEVGEATDVPVLKLFEFLVASICMFMVDDDGVPERRELDVFRLSAPEGARNKTWWTVDVRAPEADGTVDSDTERALRILLQILGMHLSAAWKSMQLGECGRVNVCGGAGIAAWRRGGNGLGVVGCGVEGTGEHQNREKPRLVWSSPLCHPRRLTCALPSPGQRHATHAYSQAC